ncbi:MAG: T9SS type A sorting domain-containing protein [Candidatus Kapabacteria bacterium]|nr:T9SS type A sorting domain-containing protein [Candidatus Kapabacteria bacterium]
MKFIFTIVVFIVYLVNFNVSISEEAWVLRIPNGSKNTCMNCHSSLLGGKNTVIAFGAAFRTNGLTWNATLAKLDSDGDGFTNGQELQDSAGVWKRNTADPGNSKLVTNPSDKNSKPTSVEENENFSFEILNLFPLPVKEDFSLSIKIKRAGLLDISLYSIDGKFISSLYTGEKAEGEYNFNFNLQSASNSSLSNGVYFIEVKQNYAILRKRFVINK